MKVHVAWEHPSFKNRFGGHPKLRPQAWIFTLQIFGQNMIFSSKILKRLSKIAPKVNNSKFFCKWSQMSSIYCIFFLDLKFKKGIKNKLVSLIFEESFSSHYY
jgi:hypothetical protein